MITAEYQNGNCTVQIKEDGTKVREYEGTPRPVHPESIDLKITDYCNLSCSFCHEQSTIQGGHADLDWAMDKLKDMPAGVEIAIGGGNPLTHPDIAKFLIFLKKRGIIANLTVNQSHITPFLSKISQFLDKELIKGLGVSVNSKNLDDIEQIYNNNVVFHLIVGVHSVSILMKIVQKFEHPKVLLLGYKQFGRGIDHYSSKVRYNIKKWGWMIRKFMDKTAVMSFDNLAIDQMKLKRFFPGKTWEEFYMGDEGQFTMYIDAVKKEYAVSSTSDRRPCHGRIKDMFKDVRNG